MYPSGESSNEGLFPAGPSTGSEQRTFEDVALEGIVVDNPSNDPHESRLSVAVPKPRPLNLADNYKIVGGVPSFVWKPKVGYTPHCRVFAISFDGIRIAIQEGWHKICVYDILDNFSLVAVWEDTNYEEIRGSAFHINHSNELVVMFRDTSVALMFLTNKSEGGAEQPNTSQQNIGALEVKNEFRILNEYTYTNNLRHSIFSHRVETWVCAWDYTIRNIVTLYSIRQGEFRRLQIKSNNSIMPALIHCSIPQRGIMLATIGNYKPLHTRIWTDLDFDNGINIESAIELRYRQGLGFSVCGCFFLTWNYNEHSEDAMEAYDIRLLKASTNPIAKRSIGCDVLRARGHFIQVDQAILAVWGYTCPKESLIAAILVASSSKVELTLWNISQDEVFRELNLTMWEMTFRDPYHVEFTISPNSKWVAVGCWTDGVFGLFSLLNGALVWQVKLKTSNILIHISVPLKFDYSSSRLIINAGNMLYVFAPPCLVEDYELEFLSTTLDFAENYEDSSAPLSIHHKALIPKHILKYALYLRHKFKTQDQYKVLDIANSRISSSVTLLIWINDMLKVVYGSLERLFAATFKKYIEYSGPRVVLPNGLVELAIDNPPLQHFKHLSPQHCVWIFLHPNEDKNEDSIVVFLPRDELVGAFIDNIETRNQVQIPFGNQECFAMKQSKDGSTVVGIHAFGVMIIDLNKRTIVSQVEYKANLARWLAPYISTRNQSCLDVSYDATSILVGWDKRNEKPLSLTSQMDNEESRTIFEENEEITPCWLINESCTMVSFLEFKNDNHEISSICLYNNESNKLKKVARKQWNLHISKVLGSMNPACKHEYALQFDESNGHLWIIALQERDDAIRLVVAPINSYFLKNCIPCLSMKEHLTKEDGGLKKLASQHGSALFLMLFNGKTNLEYAFGSQDKDIMTRVFSLALRYGISPQDVFAQGFGKQTSVNVIWNAIKNKDKVVVDVILQSLDERAVSFEGQSFVLQEGFNGLWMNYRSLFEPRIVHNSIARNVCEITIPIEVLSDDKYIEARLGTLDSIPYQWEDSSDLNTSYECWKSLHREDVQEIETKGIETTTSAMVMFFAIGYSCKIGLKGIIRFLLMQEAPSYIFKAPLLKWVIAFKWEKMWKKRSLRSLVFYLLFMSIYTIYSILIAFVGKDMHDDLASSICLTMLLLALVVMAVLLLYQEFTQLKTYISDGRKLFPRDRMWGLRKYWSSLWNLLEVLTYTIMVSIIPSLHLAVLCGVDVVAPLYVFVALCTCLIWIKVWYYAQAFEKTGAFVLMIENVIKDCVPFLTLAFCILTGFSLALFVLFQRSLKEKDLHHDKGEDEVKSDIGRCFGDPAKAMVTLFYAMIGTFEPKMYYHSGSLSPIITFAFVIYLAIQMIVMVNMLIAIMGDTFDRVKSTEEEQLLMGRARFIDACEAQLSDKEIEEIEKSIGKYLYVLFPKDEDLTEDMRLWQGRVKTIEDRIGKMIKESRMTMMDQMKEDKKHIAKGMDEMKGNLNDIMKIKEDTKDLKQIKEDIKDLKQMKKDMDDTREVLQLIKDKILE